MSVLECYIALLNMSDKALMSMVDLYNAGAIQIENTRIALEIIDGGIGLPGESVVGTFNVGVAA